jgi:hypothetical protein
MTDDLIALDILTLAESVELLGVSVMEDAGASTDGP